MRRWPGTEPSQFAFLGNHQKNTRGAERENSIYQVHLPHYPPHTLPCLDMQEGRGVKP